MLESLDFPGWLGETRTKGKRDQETDSMIKSLSPSIGLMTTVVLISCSYLSAHQTTGDLLIPPKRAHHSIAFDPTRGEVILSGGSTATADDSSTVFDDLWTWNGKRWNQLAVTALSRSGHNLIYDPARRRLLLIAGMDGQQRYGETRVFDGNRWVSLNANPALDLAGPAIGRHLGLERPRLAGS